MTNKTVNWTTANGTVNGIVLESLGKGNYLVDVGNGKSVIVNEKSFKDGDKG